MTDPVERQRPRRTIEKVGDMAMWLEAGMYAVALAAVAGAFFGLH